MIDEKVELKTDIPVLEQIVKVHNLTYKELAEKLEITDGGLRKVRSGKNGFKMTMSQVRTLAILLKPFEVRLEDLPDDWMVEKEKLTTPH